MPEDQNSPEEAKIEDVASPEQLDRIISIKQDLGKAAALDAVRISEGGRLIIGALIEDIVGAVDTIATNNSKLSHTEFIALACRIKERIDIARSINGAQSSREFLGEELRKALEEIQ